MDMAAECTAAAEPGVQPGNPQSDLRGTPMSTINDLDLGPSHPWPVPTMGQNLNTAMGGADELVWSLGGSLGKQVGVGIGVNAWRALGGQSANSPAALELLLRQLEEVASNRDLQ